MVIKCLYEPQRASESLYMTEIRNIHFIGKIDRRNWMFRTGTERNRQHGKNNK